MTIMPFMLAALATWRLTHLVAREDGPRQVFVRLRERLGKTFWGTLMDCFQCLSLWIAAPFAPWIAPEPVGCAISWLALSGAACLLERCGQQPVWIAPLASDQTGEPDYGMLRTKADGLEPAPVSRE